MKEILTAVSIICVSAVVCSIMSNFITTDRIMMHYSNLFNQYFIHDYVIYQPRQKHLDSFEIVKEQNSTYKDESFSDWTEKWEKWYKRK